MQTHLLIIPDGSRRYAKRALLTHLFKESEVKFRKALEVFPTEERVALEKRVQAYARTDEDPWYTTPTDPLYGLPPPDLFRSPKIPLYQEYLLDAYRKGGMVFETLIKWMMHNSDVQILSIYALQRRNLNRPEEQATAMSQAEAECFQRWAEDPEMCSGCNVVSVGDRAIFNEYRQRTTQPDILDEYVASLDRLVTNTNGKFKIYMLTPYDSDWELIPAYAGGHFDRQKLMVQEDVDLIMRSGASKRPISGALPKQIEFATCIAPRPYFADITIEHVKTVLSAYDPTESGL